MATAKILVVEDDLNLLSTLKYNLVKEGYDVITVVDGTVALEMARREKPKLIVLDVMLPKLSGFGVCRILRKGQALAVRSLLTFASRIWPVIKHRDR